MPIDQNFTDTNYLNPFKDNAEHLRSVCGAYKDKEKLILYFHGGLSSNNYINKKLGPMLSETTFHPKNMSYESDGKPIVYAHPVMFQWEASLFQENSLYAIFLKILKDNGIHTVFGKIYENLKKIWDWLKGKLGFGQGLYADREPSELEIASMAQTYLEDLESRAGVRGLSEDDDKDSVVKLITDELKEPEIREISQQLEGEMHRDEQEMLSVSTWKLAKAIYRVLKRYKKHRAHGFATLQEEIYREPIFFNTSIEDVATKHWELVYNHAKIIWEDGIGKDLLSDLNGRKIKIDLISHSAGSIVISSLVKHVAENRDIYPDITFNNIIFVAPAVTTKMFEDIIIGNERSGIYDNFITYNLSDKCEVKDQVGIEILYSRSLLYFVSGVAEKVGKGDTPILGMQRYMEEDIYQSDRFNRKHEKDYGNLQNVRWYLTQGDRLKYLPLDAVDLDCKESGSSHGGTKKPCESKALARDIVNLISDNRIGHGNVYLDCPVDTGNDQDEYEDL